jgi:hypothetical protein
MKRKTTMTQKRRQPAPNDKATLIGVRLQRAQLDGLDAWIAKQKPAPTRPEAIRGMIDAALHPLAKGTAKSPASGRLRDRAREMAGSAIDDIADGAADVDDQAGRKRRLLKGPEEFREARIDRPKRKT